MRATKFEFEQRFWIFGSIFFVGFSLYKLDKVNVVSWLVHSIWPGLDLNTATADNRARLILGLGAAVVFLAAILRTWATAYLKTDVVHDMKQHSEGMVADGPYRYVRNPLYFANLPMAIGVGVMASRVGWIFIVVAMTVFAYRLILFEEDGLRREQGGAYAEYLKTVPRFWPSLKARVPPSGARAHWGQAFAGESMFWFFGLAELIFAITLNLPVSAVVFGLSFAVYFLAVYLVKKRSVAVV